MGVFEIQDALFHLPFFGEQALILNLVWRAKLNKNGTLGSHLGEETHDDVPMSFKVEYCERTHVTQPFNVNCEISEEVHNIWRTLWQCVPEDEGREDDGEKLLDKYHHFHWEQLTKILVCL